MSMKGILWSLALGMAVLACQAIQAQDYEDLVRCPAGMADINGRYCIDEYEFPNKKGEYAVHGVSQERAAFLCQQAGKRLCSRNEWQAACAGPDRGSYPYGDEYEKGICSDPYTAEGRGHYKSGDMEMCANGYGLFDMSGNLAEWTADTFEGGSLAAIQGGDAYTEDPYALSCNASFSRSAESEDPYNGFRCCANLLMEPVKRSQVQGMPVRGAESAQVHNPATRNERTFSMAVEYLDTDELIGSDAAASYVDMSGINLTASYQFKGGRFDYTRMEYDVGSVNAGTPDSSNVGLNVFHGSLLVPIAMDFWGWTGDVYMGARRLDSSAGNLTDLYVTKEYIEGFWTLIPSLNRLESAASGITIGFGLDARYHMNPHMDFLVRYNSADFYKSLLNDFIVPYTNNAGTLLCQGCREDSTAAGIDYVLPGRRTRLYLMWYDIGDMDIPIGGASMDF